jgi:dienelactone hydrolase
MKHLLSICLLLLFGSFSTVSAQEEATDFQGEMITFNSGDGIQITADLYMSQSADAPFIILFHQAGYSRGEYREIAPRLNSMGFNCMAVDQRSGKEINGVKNQTHEEAVSKNLPTEYLDALADIEAAYVYVKHGIKPEKIILWGSSYSASLMFYMGSEHHKNISGILAFAPAEYFKINGKTIATYASRVTAPVFITSAKNEYPKWKPIYEEVKSDKFSYLPDNEGKHGSKALWSSNPGNDRYWGSVVEFLSKLK